MFRDQWGDSIFVLDLNTEHRLQHALNATTVQRKQVLQYLYEMRDSVRGNVSMAKNTDFSLGERVSFVQDPTNIAVVEQLTANVNRLYNNFLRLCTM